MRNRYIKFFAGAGKQIAVILLCGLSVVSKAQTTVAYNLNDPQIIELPKEIDEISGMVWYKDHSVFAVDDNHGKLYKIPLQKNPKIESWEFGKAKDYESLALAGNTFYLLSSKGNVISFPFSFPVKEVEEYKLKLKEKNEFEILYHDPKADQLVLLCKECSEDKKKENTAWAFDITRKKFTKEPAYVLDKKELEEKLGESMARFKPSAAAINPVTGNLYIISSINKVLVVLNNSNKKVHTIYKLDKKLFKQPEGIAFTASGDLLISNEAAGSDNATILIYHRQ